MWKYIILLWLRQMIMAWIAITRSLWASGALRKLDGLKVFLSSKIEDDEMRKTAICSIRFTECVLLLEAAALNYTVDYYHNCAAGVIVPPSSPSDTEIVFFCNAACWSEDKNYCIGELNLHFNFTRTRRRYTYALEHAGHNQNLRASPVF